MDILVNISVLYYDISEYRGKQTLVFYFYPMYNDKYPFMCGSNFYETDVIIVILYYFWISLRVLKVFNFLFLSFLLILNFTIHFINGAF